MVQFTPFQQSSLFNTIAGGGGTPLGAVPMNFATATPYKWNTDPITPDPETPENDFDMGVFCSVPANANHPMCVNNANNTTDNEKLKIKIKGTDRFTMDDNFIPTDEEIANMTNAEYLANLQQRGWLKNSMLGVLPSKGSTYDLKSGQMFSPYLTLAFGKGQEARRQKLIQELQNRGLLDAMQTGGDIKINLNNAYNNKSKSGLLMIDEIAKAGIKDPRIEKLNLYYDDKSVKRYKDTKGTKPDAVITTDSKTKYKKEYDKLKKKLDNKELNLGQFANQYRKDTGYFSPAQTRDREKSYQQPQGKKGSYSYRAKGR
jgi:hypothetical protein